MNVNKIVKMVCNDTFKAHYAGEEREFAKFGFVVFNTEGKIIDVQSVVVTLNKLNKALNYSKIDKIDYDHKYKLWLSDYKGDKKLRFAGISIYDGK